MSPSRMIPSGKISSRMIGRALPLLLVLGLSACGFQLRDALVLPPDLGPVKVVSVDRYSPLAQSLAQSLTRAGAEPATSMTSDAAVLDLLAEEWGDTPISVDTFGRAQEFSLRYAVIFELRRADGSALVPRQTIELARDYISVPTRSEGTQGEREILVRELQREMAASVLRRIDAVSQRDGAFVEGATPTAESSVAPADSAQGVGIPTQDASLRAADPAASTDVGTDGASDEPPLPR